MVVKKKSPERYTVYQVPNDSKPVKIVDNLTRLQAKKVVKNSRTGRSFFVGFVKKGTKVTRFSSFNTGRS